MGARLVVRWSPATVPRRRPSRRGLSLALAAAALATAACSAGPSPDGATADGRARAAQPSLSSADRSVVLRVADRDRSYLLQPAQGLSEGDAAAMVVVLHQEGGTPEGVAAETALQDLRARGATLVYPAGVEGSWDAGACCGTGPSRSDDLAFLDAVFADVARRTPVDDRRRALVGYSSGGMLTYRYLCSRSEPVAVAVVVSGSLESECADGLTTPDVLALHGKKDGTIGFAEPIFISSLGLAPRPVETSLRLYTQSAGCAEPATDTRAEVEVRLWESCRGGMVEAVLVADAGHGWAKLDATRHTQDFLVDHLLT